jgi:hypothetical protein
MSKKVEKPEDILDHKSHKDDSDDNIITNDYELVIDI